MSKHKNIKITFMDICNFQNRKRKKAMMTQKYYKKIYNVTQKKVHCKMKTNNNLDSLNRAIVIKSYFLIKQLIMLKTIMQIYKFYLI